MNRKIPVVYADFNGIRISRQTNNSHVVPLDTYGTLKGLTNQKIRLKEGMELVIYMDSADDEDLEAKSIVHFDPSNQFWVAEINKDDILYVPGHQEWHQEEFLCFQCRKNLEPFFEKHGRNKQTCCPDCGFSIFYPISPPE